MDSPDLSLVLTQWADELLTWVGFGTLVGLLAKAILPGRDPGGTVTTLAMGIVGTFIGCSLLMYVGNMPRVSPISPLGFLAGTAGAVVLLVFYRLMRGRYFREPGMSTGRVRRPYYRRGYSTRGVEADELSP